MDFGNRNNFLIFHSSASYVIMKIQYVLTFFKSLFAMWKASVFTA